MCDAFGGTGTPLGGFMLSAVIIGASTGGPHVVESIIRALPADLPVPIAVCQHMPPGFTATWAERLDRLCWLTVREAVNHERFVKGTVYVAPAGMHMRITGTPRDARIRLDSDFADAFFVPSIDFLMSSAAAVYRSGTLGVLLTGIGSDGALGMLGIRRAGGYTLVEAPESAIAPSMPTSAAELGAAAEIVSAADMPRVIVERVNGIVASR